MKATHLTPVLSVLFVLCWPHAAAAQGDDGLDDDFFDEDDPQTDTEGPTPGRRNIEADLPPMEPDTDDFVDIPDPDAPCRALRTDYVEILSPAPKWPVAGDRTFQYLWVRWETDGALTDNYSQCCWIADESTPRCETREMPSWIQRETQQVALDATSMAERFIPYHRDSSSADHHSRYSLNFRSTASFNPARANGLVGFDIDVTASALGRGDTPVCENPFHMYARSLSVFGAWRWFPEVRNRKTGAELTGRHHLGINIRWGMIPQSTDYAVTFDDMPIYQFVGGSIAYATAQEFRHYRPFSHGLLARTGLEERSRLGGYFESNNFFTLPIKNAHVLGIDLNTQVGLLGSAMQNSYESMSLDTPVRMGSMAAPLDPGHRSGGLIVAPKLNVGAVTKTDTLRLHLAYTGEYSVRPEEVTNRNGFSENSSRLSTVLLNMTMHFFQLQLSHSYLRDETESDAFDSGSRTTTRHLTHVHLAFHLFQIIAKRNQTFDRYRHALSFHGEYLYNSGNDTGAATQLSQRFPSSRHAFNHGITSVIPLVPLRKKLATRPHGMGLDFIGDLSAAYVNRERYVAAIVGLRMSPF